MHAGGQRHRLLLDLRRQPADHALVHDQRDGRGPAWSNSLFEDNAEFGLGMRLWRLRSVSRRTEDAMRWSAWMTRATIADGLSSLPSLAAITVMAELDDDGSREHAGRGSDVRARPCRRDCASKLDAARRCWQIYRDRPLRAGAGRRRRRLSRRRACGSSAGDGWAYDIGFGGLDHVLVDGTRRQRSRARHRGLLEHRRGQQSKATPLGATAAKFATAGQARSRRKTSV